MVQNLVLPKFGKPRQCIRRFPKGSYAIRKETSYFRGKYIYKRKRPIYHVVKITGFLDMPGTFGVCGLNTREISKHYDLGKAKEKAMKLNLRRNY